LRTLYSRKHATVYPGKGVFLAGPTPPNGEMVSGWRRPVIDRLAREFEDEHDYIVVAPEPEDGHWQSIESNVGSPNQSAENDQIAWELQYLKLCDVTAFWLPVYWDEASAENFPANIGPTTRWEFGMMLQQFISDPTKKLVIGAPEDAQSIGWVEHTAKHYNVEIHWLPSADKNKLVCDSFISAIAVALRN